MNQLGVFEIFFGPPWTMDERVDWADFLCEHGLGFYFYGPKADANLRKAWLKPWPPDYLTLLGVLAGEFRMRGVKFGVALSPFGVEFPVSIEIKKALREKVAQLADLGVDFLGLFFDDMKSIDHLADMQLELLAETMSAQGLRIVFCPSYYSPDPILDKVFGPRPLDYLERLGREIPSEVEILWTGPKVISPEIPVDHLKEVTALLRRKPFICDNLFANDGPKNCKFLKLREFVRAPEALTNSNAWALNPMNQSALSEVMVLNAKKVFAGEASGEAALKSALAQLCSLGLAENIWSHRDLFMNSGLDQIDDERKKTLSRSLRVFAAEPVAQEILRWLSGEFVVGNECLTD